MFLAMSTEVRFKKSKVHQSTSQPAIHHWFICSFICSFMHPSHRFTHSVCICICIYVYAFSMPMSMNIRMSWSIYSNEILYHLCRTVIAASLKQLHNYMNKCQAYISQLWIEAANCSLMLLRGGRCPSAMSAMYNALWQFTAIYRMLLCNALLCISIHLTANLWDPWPLASISFPEHSDGGRRSSWKISHVIWQPQYIAYWLARVIDYDESIKNLSLQYIKSGYRCELSERVGVGNFLVINLETLTPLLKMHL